MRAVERADVQDLERELDAQERAARRHTLWAALGVSPAGLLPLAAAASDFAVGAPLAGVVLISGVEAWRAVRARAKAARLRHQMGRLLAEPSSGVEP